MVFAPAAEAIYPRGLDSQTFVDVPRFSGILEGASRPGPFPWRGDDCQQAV